jgi:hypothetical protein
VKVVLETEYLVGAKMTGAEVLNVIMSRIGTGSGVTSIHTELNSVLNDLSSRADFLTTVSPIVTVADTAEYDEPAGLKRIYECSISGGSLLEKKTYRQYLEAIEDGSAALTGEPQYYARRHGKLYLWPMPDAVYTVNIDYARYHPDTWSDVSFGVQFNEAIYEGVLAALYRGQLFEKLRLNNKKINSDKLDESVTEPEVGTTVTDLDESGEVLSYEFDKDFPEITKHAAAYEAEIEKLIENMNMDIETVLVEYRDI